MTPTSPTLDTLLGRADALLGRLETWLPAAPVEPDWSASTAFRYRRRACGPWTDGPLGGVIEPVRQVDPISFDHLKAIETQKARLRANTAQFVAGRPANNVLLTGARGTGKSALVKACLQAFAPQGLRLIEVDKADMVDLPDIVERVATRAERFVVYCDDLGFDEGEPGYKALKSMLDGTVRAAADNVLVYATSNRRHLLPEPMRDNVAPSRGDAGELHPGEAVEEKVSLSERFGLWISFHPFSQPEYLAIAGEWLRRFGFDDDAIAAARGDALRWALERGSRSGRVAHQFARDRAGRQADNTGVAS